jgi:hypothetical protein
MSTSRLLTRRAAVALLATSTSVRADERLEATLKRLAAVKRFAFGGVGVAGVISEGETDFKLVLSEPSSVALAAFEKLYGDGNPQAKCYALRGMRKLSAARFRELLSVAAASTEQVEVMRGCIILRERFGKVAKEIDNGGFRF